MINNKELIIKDDDYKKLIQSIKIRFKNSQIKAAMSINAEMLKFYWITGREIHNLQSSNKYGSSFFKSLSNDLKNELKGVKGLSVNNLRYMEKFYELYQKTILQQLAEKSIAYDENTIFQQAAGIFDILFSLPWGHHMAIIDKCTIVEDKKALFFVYESLKNNWSRAVLLNFIDTDLYERQGKAISNFSLALPDANKDLAQEITKDPYKFDFLEISKDHDERQLKDALMDHITDFLMEMGKGFSFVGREYPLPIDGTTEFIDLLFYHLVLHCYVIVEVKVKPFSSRDVGQTATYVAIADDLIKTEYDNKTIGLIICKEKNSVLAQYAVKAIAEPIGISSYKIEHLLPSEEEIQKGLENL